jgi:hypothetical protein
VGLWQEILEAVGRASPFTKNYLIEAHPVNLAKNVFTIGFDPEFAEHIDFVNNQKTHALLQTKLSEQGRPNTQIKFVKAERPESWVSRTHSGPEAMSGGDPGQNTPGPATSAQPASPASSTAGSSSNHGRGPQPQQAASTSPAPTKKASLPPNAEEFKNDPLIQKALELFKGRIVEVRA